MSRRHGSLYFADLAEKTNKLTNPAKILANTYDIPIWWSRNEISPEPVFTARCVCIAGIMPWQDDCPFVRPSITLHYSVWTVTHILKVFSSKISDAVLVFLYQTGWQYSDEHPPTWAPNARGIKNHESYYKKRIRNRTQLFEWYHFQWPWVISNPDFKVIILFNTIYHKNITS